MEAELLKELAAKRVVLNCFSYGFCFGMATILAALSGKRGWVLEALFLGYILCFSLPAIWDLLRDSRRG